MVTEALPPEDSRRGRDAELPAFEPLTRGTRLAGGSMSASGAENRPPLSARLADRRGTGPEHCDNRLSYSNIATEGRRPDVAAFAQPRPQAAASEVNYA